MNEIRMYVERLFQGKTLTDDIIELKEEIYGNLVARYEDYLAEGMSEADALAKTKASMTSVDDVLAGEADASKDETASATNSVTTEFAAAAAETAVSGAPANPASSTPTTTPADSVPVFSFPVLFFNKKWLAAAVMVAVVVILGGIGFKIVDEMNDAREDQLEQQHDQERYDAAKKDLNVRNGEDEITIDSDGTVRYDGDVADELLTDVVNAGVGELRPFMGTNLADGATVEQAVRALPMSEYATDIDVTKGDCVLSLAYRNVPDFDGDSIDAALVYNATALFCMIPDAVEVQVTVAEADDPVDEDNYVFKRGMMEAEGGYSVSLNGTMLNESNWDQQIKRDHLYKENFIERMIDQAERNGR